jgi:hypothetical protein
VDALITILSSLISGLIGVVISTLYYHRFEKRKTRLDTLIRFAGNRYDVKGDEFSRAANEISVVFQHSAEVIAALSTFHEKVVARQDSTDALVRLFKAMCDDLGVKYDRLNDSFFLRPFNTKQANQP